MGGGSGVDAAVDGLDVEDEWQFEVEEAEPATEVASKNQRTPVPFPTEPPEGGTWREYFQRVKAQRLSDRADVQNAPSYPVARFPIPPERLSAAPKKAYKAALALGMEIGIRATLIYHPVEYMVGDGKQKKDGTQAMRGDVKKAETLEYRVEIVARRSEYRYGFHATWSDGGFVDAACNDRAVGFPREAWFDYKPIKPPWVKGMVPSAYERMVEQAERVSNQRHVDYNDGQVFVWRAELFKSATDFLAWLTDWMVLTIPGYERPIPKTKKKPEPEAPALAANEWSAA